MAPIRFPFEDPPSVGAVVEVASGVFWARMPMPRPLNHVNVFVLDDGDGWTVVDTGLGVEKVRAAWDALLAGPLAGKPVRRVIVTHYHPDHLGLAGLVSDHSRRRGLDQPHRLAFWANAAS